MVILGVWAAGKWISSLLPTQFLPHRDSGLISFLDSMIKYPENSSVTEEGAVLVYSSKLQSMVVRESQCQELEGLSHVISTVIDSFICVYGVHSVCSRDLCNLSKLYLWATSTAPAQKLTYTIKTYLLPNLSRTKRVKTNNHSRTFLTWRRPKVYLRRQEGKFWRRKKRMLKIDQLGATLYKLCFYSLNVSFSFIT